MASKVTLEKWGKEDKHKKKKRSVFIVTPHPREVRKKKFKLKKKKQREKIVCDLSRVEKKLKRYTD
jgi:hypothetical protein